MAIAQLSGSPTHSNGWNVEEDTRMMLEEDEVGIWLDTCKSPGQGLHSGDDGGILFFFATTIASLGVTIT